MIRACRLKLSKELHCVPKAVIKSQKQHFLNLCLVFRTKRVLRPKEWQHSINKKSVRHYMLPIAVEERTKENRRRRFSIFFLLFFFFFYFVSSSPRPAAATTTKTTYRSRSC